MISTSARRLFVQAIKTHTDACVTNNGLGWFSGCTIDATHYKNTLISRFDTRFAYIISQSDGKGDSTVVVEISDKTKGLVRFHFCLLASLCILCGTLCDILLI